MSPYPPPSPVLLNQRAVSYSVFSVMRESVSFQVCPEFIRTIIQSGRGPRSLEGRQGGRHGEGTQRSEFLVGVAGGRLSLKSCLRYQWLHLWSIIILKS